MIDGIVLRTVQYRDHDVIVELLTAEEGRLSAIARGAKKSRKRYGAALELGNRVRLEFGRSGKNLRSIGTIDVTKPSKAVRSDLDRFHQLAYALELTARLAPEGQPDRAGYELLDGFLDRLEAWPATPLGLVTWEVAVLTYHGFGVQFWPCVHSGGPAEMLSLSAGGAYARSAANYADGRPIAPRALEQLGFLANGAESAVAIEACYGEIRRALDHVWTLVTGKALKSARFLYDEARILPGELNESASRPSALPTPEDATTP